MDESKPTTFLRTALFTSPTRCLLVALTIGVTACQSPNVLYVSDTTIGLADVGGNVTMPTELTLGMKNYELVAVPDRADGDAHSVLGYIDADLNANLTQGNVIHQGMATGSAAGCVAYQLATSSETIESQDVGADLCAEHYALANSPTPRKSIISNAAEATHLGRDKALVTGATTRMGIRIGYGDGEAVGANFLTFDRRVFASIPVVREKIGNDGWVDKEVRPVFSDTFVNSKEQCASAAQGQSNTPSAVDDLTKTAASEKGCSITGGVRITQTLATGHAARLMALKNADKLIEKMKPQDFGG